MKLWNSAVGDVFDASSYFHSMKEFEVVIICSLSAASPPILFFIFFSYDLSLFVLANPPFFFFFEICFSLSFIRK
jgi:hypothetical protein